MVHLIWSEFKKSSLLPQKTSSNTSSLGNSSMCRYEVKASSAILYVWMDAHYVTNPSRVLNLFWLTARGYRGRMGIQTHLMLIFILIFKRCSSIWETWLNQPNRWTQNPLRPTACKPKAPGKYWTSVGNALCSASFGKHFLLCIIKKTGQKEIVGLSLPAPSGINGIPSVNEVRVILFKISGYS